MRDADEMAGIPPPGPPADTAPTTEEPSAAPSRQGMVLTALIPRAAPLTTSDAREPPGYCDRDAGLPRPRFATISETTVTR
jgi:hypothetical protein